MTCMTLFFLEYAVGGFLSFWFYSKLQVMGNAKQNNFNLYNFNNISINYMQEALIQPQGLVTLEQLANFQAMMDKAPEATKRFLGRMGLTREQLFQSLKLDNNSDVLRASAFDSMPPLIRDNFFGFCPKPSGMSGMNNDSWDSLNQNQADKSQADENKRTADDASDASRPISK